MNNDEMVAKMKKMAAQRDKELEVLRPLIDAVDRDKALDAAIEYTCMQFGRWLTGQVDVDHPKAKDLFAALATLIGLAKETNAKRGKWQQGEYLSTSIMCRLKDADGDWV